jgi:hypothetical protein
MKRPPPGKTDLRGADVEVLQIVALQSGDPHRIRRVLTDAGDIPLSVVPHVIPLLASASATDAMHALRRTSLHRPGILIDALADVRLPPVVRRRVARVLSVCRSPLVIAALLTGSDDEHISVRVQCARSLFVLKRRHPEVEVGWDEVVGLVHREIERGIQDVGLVFTFLGLVLPSGAIRGAYRSLRGSNANARGFALEYLHGVLPTGIRDKLMPVLTEMGRNGRTSNDSRGREHRESSR